MVLKNFQFAAHRWESSSTPKRRFAFLLGPVMLALAARAVDVRTQPADMKQAMALLAAMTPEFIIRAGLSADFNAEVLAFIRFFDQRDADPALFREKFLGWRRRMKSLFCDAEILKELQGRPAEEQSATWLIITQAMALPPLYVHDKVFTAWPRTLGLGQAQGAAKTKCFETMASVQTVVDLTLQRVEAELPQTGLFADLSVFDLHSVPEHPGQEWWDSKRRRLNRLCAPKSLAYVAFSVSFSRHLHNLSGFLHHDSAVCKSARLNTWYHSFKVSRLRDRATKSA